MIKTTIYRLFIHISQITFIVLKGVTWATARVAPTGSIAYVEIVGAVIVRPSLP